MYCQHDPLILTTLQFSLQTMNYRILFCFIGKRGYRPTDAQSCSRATETLITAEPIANDPDEEDLSHRLLSS